MNINYIRNNIYGKYYVPDSQLHRPVAASIAKGEVWEKETIQYIINNLNNKSVITAGAYYGDFLPAISKSTSAKVFTFEPVPELFEYAKKTIRLNQLPNTFIYNQGLSNQTGKGFMELVGKRNDHIGFKGKSLSLGGASYIVPEATKTTIDIELTTLDSVISTDSKISVIHLDVERHENEALEGAKKIINVNRPLIITESDIKKELLSSFGYFFAGKVNSNRIFKTKSV